jgi:hypothetical protein
LSLSQNSFTKKQLRVTFTLSNGQVFAASGANSAPNQIILSGLRMSARIECKGMPAFPSCTLDIWGMRQSDMNALSALTLEVTGNYRNSMLLEANSGVGWTAVYAGQIVSSFIDYSNRPDVPLRISSQMLFFDLVNPVPPTSYANDSVPVATAISNLAAKMGCAFENNGVSTTLSGNPYYPGTYADQMRQIAQHAGIDLYQEPSIASGAVPGLSVAQSSGTPTTVIAICPKGQPRNLVNNFVLTPQTGLVGYPAIDSRGLINVRALYNPSFRFGGPLAISGSDVVLEGTGKNIGLLNSRADGNWMISTMAHTLEALKFDGGWFSDMLLIPPGMSPVQQ